MMLKRAWPSSMPMFFDLINLFSSKQVNMLILVSNHLLAYVLFYEMLTLKVLVATIDALGHFETG